MLNAQDELPVVQACTELVFDLDALLVRLEPYMLNAQDELPVVQACTELVFDLDALLSERKGFWVAEFSDFQGSSQLLTSSHLRERDEMLLRAILCGGVWNGFLLGKAKKENVPCRYCGERRLFCECTFPLLLHVREGFVVFVTVTLGLLFWAI